MMNEETRRKLRELFLEEMIDALELQENNPTCMQLSFDQRMKLLVDHVYQEKYTNKVKRLIKGARFRIPNADIHEVYYVDRGIDRQQLTQLAACQFVSATQNICFQGFTGSGKSFLACALGKYKEACKQGIRTHYIRLPDLLAEYEDGLQEKLGVQKLLKKYTNYPLLILDEWLIQIPTQEELHFLFELIERRYDAGAMIFCTQFKTEDWHSRLGSGILADSILDRVIHKTTAFYAGDLNMRELLAKRKL